MEASFYPLSLREGSNDLDHASVFKGTSVSLSGYLPDVSEP